MNQFEDNWRFFDRIYCISLDRRNDRREQVKRQFADVGLLELVEFVIVAKHPADQEEGIFRSHMICLDKGLKANARRILIFEDDVFFKDFDTRVLGEVCTCLDATTHWNAFFLGCITAGSSKTKNKNLVKITYRCLAHAYALNHPFARRLVQEPWSGIPFDELLRRHAADFYALYPMCAYQGLAGTDNQTVVIDRIRRYCGGLPFIQMANELYQNHKLLLLLAPLAVFLAVAIVAFRLW